MANRRGPTVLKRDKERARQVPVHGVDCFWNSLKMWIFTLAVDREVGLTGGTLRCDATGMRPKPKFGSKVTRSDDSWTKKFP